MDQRIRRLQRLVASGDIKALDEIDRLLRLSGHQLISHTDPHGSEPGLAVYLAALESGLYGVAIRDRSGLVSYFMEEVDMPGEHVGEYLYEEARQLAEDFLAARVAYWLAGEVCADPRCAVADRVIIEQIRETSWEEPTTQLWLRCVECGYRWIDYTG